MSPVSNMQDFAIGVTGKRSSALPFDPIASRNADRPKFRLDDYERKEPADARRADTASYERSTRAQKTSDSARESARENDQMRTRPSEESRNADKASKNAAPSNATETTAALPQKADPIRQSTDDGAVPTDNGAHAQAPRAGDEVEVAAVTAESEAAANTNDVEASRAAAAAAETDVTGMRQQPASAKSAQQSEVPNVPAQNQAQTSNQTAVNQEPPAPAAATQDVTVKDGAAEKTAAVPVKAVTDPKLAALQTLTQPRTAPAETPALANAAQDKTAFTLPVPWPQKPGIQKASADIPAGTAVRAAQADAQTASAAAANAKTAGTQAPASNPNGATVQLNQGTYAAAPGSAAAQNRPTIEVEHPAAARQHVPSDTAALLAGNRAAGNNGQPKQNSLPSQSDTIAAVTALNSRVPRSNALGAAPQSNAVSSAVEKASAQGTATAGQAATTIIGAANAPQSAATNNGGAQGSVPQVTGQLPVGSAESALGGRSRSGTGQGFLSESGTNASNASRSTEAPSTPSGSSFGDNLRAAGTERSAPVSETRQSLPSSPAEQVKVKLVKAAEGGLDKIKIQLNPSELGKVEVRLEFGSDSGVRGIVTVEKPETLQLLQRDARQLEQALQDAGFKTGDDGLEFQMRGGDTNDGQQNAGTGNGSHTTAGGDLTAEQEQLATATAGTEQDGISDDGSLNMVA